MDSLRPHGLHSPWNSPGQNTGVGSLSLLQGIFPGTKPRSPTQSCPTLCNPMDCSLPGSSVHSSSGKNTGVGSHFLLQWIFPNQGLNLRQADSLPSDPPGKPFSHLNSSPEIWLCLNWRCHPRSHYRAVKYYTVYAPYCLSKRKTDLISKTDSKFFRWWTPYLQAFCLRRAHGSVRVQVGRQSHYQYKGIRELLI